jgi:7-carboxy-7-deazaguanine synthase
VGDAERVGNRARMSAFPVVEVFGPTIQGEGELAGMPTAFVRFGGCDYRCTWCDSLHAVLPEDVRRAPRLTAAEIATAVGALDGRPAWVTLSGGNPALLELGGLVSQLHAEGRRVAVETQGSVWRDWLGDVDLLTISPKPPSSGMATAEHEAETHAFIRRAATVPAPAVIKVVVFDEPDYEWASRLRARHPGLPFHLSCGTDPPGAGESHEAALAGISARYRWLAERASADPDMAGARILPQLHVLAWGHELGH